MEHRQGRSKFSLRVDDDEPMAAGLPLRWFQRQPDGHRLDTCWARHPISWLKWRREVHRRGPYAPDFEQWLRSHRRGS